MRTRTIIAGLAGAALLAVPTAVALDAAPLPRRDGVVVAWNARSTTAVVVTGNRRVYAVHTLRRVGPGSRVRVNGLRWGTATSGIKWSAAPSGVKWGIKLARNGSYQSRLTRLGSARTTALRARVVRRYGRRAVAVAIRGAAFVLPLARYAVWLPGGTSQKEAAPLGAFGSTVVINISFDRRGRPAATRVTQVAPPVQGATVPIAGRVIAVDAAARTMTVHAGTTAFPAPLVIHVPAALDLGRYPVGSQVAGQVVQAPAPESTLHAVELSLNATFAHADSPATSAALPAPDPAHVAAAAGLHDRWVSGRNAGLVPNTGLFTSSLNRLERVGFLISVSEKAIAIHELDQLAKRLDKQADGDIHPTFRAEIAVAARALRDQLAG